LRGAIVIPCSWGVFFRSKPTRAQLILKESLIQTGKIKCDPLLAAEIGTAGNITVLGGEKENITPEGN
jgi:hypothetical protein